MWRQIAETVIKVYLILGEIFVFIYACVSAKTVGSYNLGLAFGLFLAVLVGGTLTLFLTSMMMGLVTEGVRHLENISRELMSMNLSNGKSTQIPYPEENGRINLSAAVNKTDINVGEWRCRNCEAKNAANAIFCKSCGTHK